MTAVLGLALGLAACGTEDATSPGSAAAGDADAGSSVAETPQISSEGDSPVASSADPGDERTGEEIGRVLINERLAVNPANAPLPDVPTQVIVADTAELASIYATAPGIDEIVSAVDAQGLEAGERLFAYLVSACTTKDVALETVDGKITMVVRGTATLRCAPPTTLVVWAVGDEVAADAVIGQAIQK